MWEVVRMSELSKERFEEKKRVSRVVQTIDHKAEDIIAKSSDLKESVIDLRKNFWEDVTINLEHPDDIIETEASIKQQAELLSERERTHGHLSEELKHLRLLRDSPYFARIDFKEDSAEYDEQIYIGTSSLMDEAEENFLIYDWRAPISSLYYDHTPGQADYETVEGTVTGDMSLKRQFIIRQGQLEGMFDTGVTIVDGLLQQALGNNASTTMKSIVATIQKEQNKIIRHERSRSLVVQGVAGSGKTSAVLQRIAYLMYRYRGKLKPTQMLMFSPNPLFSSYVSNVLPELGESNIGQTTFQDFLKDRIGDTLAIESPFKQMEYVLSEKENEAYPVRMENIQYKSSEAYKQMIDAFVNDLHVDGIQFRNITLSKRVLIRKEDIAQYFYSFDQHMSLPNRMENTLKWLLKQLEHHQEKEKNKQWVMRQVEMMDQEDYLQAYYQSQETGEADGQTEEQILRSLVVERLFSSIKQRLKDYAFVRVTATYKQLFKDFKPEHIPNNWQALCVLTEQYLADKTLLWEEATPYAYFKDQLIGATENRSMRYLFIDEAQDYTAFQLAYIHHLFPYTQMTFLGDINQAIYAYASEQNPFVLNEPEHQEKITLTKSYRSTKQIVEFTISFTPGEEEIIPFNRDGAKPKLIDIQVDQLGEEIQQQINDLIGHGHESIAIICQTMQETSELYHLLKDKQPIRLIHEETYEFQKGVVILPVYLAKGIEFDAVIIPDASNETYGEAMDQTLFYTACTRAMHELVMLVDGEESRFIQMVPEEKYDRY